MPAPRSFVIVSGPPASGKSTLAPILALRLALPLLAKDTIKDALMTSLGVANVEESRRLGRVSFAVLYALAEASSVGAVLESVFSRSVASVELGRLPGAVVEVFCRCDRDLVQRRHQQRAATRHLGHFDTQRAADELWNDEISQPVAGGWPVIEVDTSVSTDYERLVCAVQAAMSDASDNERA